MASFPASQDGSASRDAANLFGQPSSDAPTSANDLQQMRAPDVPSNTMALNGSGTNGSPTFNAPSQPVDADTRPQTSPERVAQGVLNMGDDQATPPNSTPSILAKKRSKTSRACDECRRKKIRCDATFDNPSEACTNCKRTGTFCQFSRQPMKRGPSKGYIKDLTERLDSLESQLGPGASAQSPYTSHIFSNQMTASAAPDGQGFYPHEPIPGTRKRKLSGIGQNAGSEPLPEQALSLDQLRFARIQASGPSSQVPVSNGPDYQTPASPGTLHNNQFADRGNPFGFGGPREQGRRETFNGSYEEDAMRDTDPTLGQDSDEGILDEYYRLIHPTLPLLPNSRRKLRDRIFKCPPTLQEAFKVALGSVIRSYPSSNFQGKVDVSASVIRAAALLSSYQFEPASSRTPGANLAYIQTLVFMTLEADNHGPATMRDQLGPPRAEWLGRAIGMATHLKLNAMLPRDSSGEGDPDSDERIGRRIWWILFILDRWHASSTSGLLQLSDHGATLLHEDRVLLGEPTYHLTRLSYILGHLSQVLQQPPSLMSPSSPAAGIITTTILGEIDRFRESVESLLLGAPNLVHLCYWHVRLMIMRLTSYTTPHELLAPAMRMAATLNSPHTTVTPLNHHCAALAAMTLCELADFDETREGAQKGIVDLADALGTKRGFSVGDESAGWDSAIRDLIARRRSSNVAENGGANGDEHNQGANTGLQHLADAAIRGRGNGAPAASDRRASSSAASTTKPTPEGGAYNPTLMIRTGYLAALAQKTHDTRV